MNKKGNFKRNCQGFWYTKSNMKKWQKYWLWLVLFIFLTHLLRDIFQDIGIKSFLSTFLYRTQKTQAELMYWQIFNTYVIEISEISLASFCLIRKKFKKIGYLTIFIAVLFLILWLYYWFFL